VKLFYFPSRGRGEQIRLLCEELEIPYDNMPVTGASFMQLKRDLPFGSIPMLQDGDFQLVQGCAIMSYLAKKFSMELNKLL